MKHIALILAACFAISCNNKLKIKSDSFILDATTVVKIGQLVKESEGELQLTLTGIPEDSRCPVNVNCIWEGQVKLFIDAAVPNRKASLEFKVEKSKMGTVSKSFEGYSIQILNVLPEPTAGEKTEPTAYTVELVVSKE